jgi:hypothetical protein
MAKTTVCKKSSGLNTSLMALLLFAAPAMFFTTPLQAASDQSSSKFGMDRSALLLLGLHMGGNIPQAKGYLFGQLTNTLTLDKSDFRAPVYGFDIGTAFHPHFAAIASFDYTRFTKDSEYRRYIDNNGDSIVQTTRLYQTSLVGTLRYYPIKMGETVGSYTWIPARVLPYIGAGGGVIYYGLTQCGDFVDERTYDIYYDKYTSRTPALIKHVAAGFDVSLSSRIVVNMEARYSWANAGMSTWKNTISQDYNFLLKGSTHANSEVDLSGLKVIGGLYIRF